ncbi:MAG: hypothetical protein ACYC26_15140 [Phycisphaerales bacterium]
MRLKMIPLLIVLMGAVTASAEGEPAPVAETPGAKAALAEINQLIEKNIPEEYRTPPAPLPDERNAWTWWKQAVAMLDAIPIEKSRVFWHLDDNPATLTDEQITQAEQWLKELQPVFDLVEQGNRAGDFRVTMKLDFSDMPHLGPFRRLMHLYLFRAERAMQRRDFAATEKYLASVMAMGDLMSSGDNLLVPYLVGIAIRGWTVKQINTWLPQHTNQAFLTALLKIVPEEQHVGARVKRTLHAEIATFCIPVWRKSAVELAADQPEKVRVNWAKIYLGLQWRNLSDEQISKLVRFLTENTIAFHPELSFQHEAPALLASLEQAEAPWNPDFLSPRPKTDQLDLFGVPQVLIDRVQANQPLDPAELQDAIRSVNDPPEDSTVKRALLLDRANIALQHMTRLNIAIRLFQLQTGQLPQSLQELVTHKILDRLPVDPFSDERLHYDPQRLLLWSVGKNAIDDHGDEGPVDADHSTIDAPDLVQRIAPPSR